MLNGACNETKTRNEFILGKTLVVYLVTRRVSVTKLKPITDKQDPDKMTAAKLVFCGHTLFV